MILKKGSRGNAVLQVQSLLNALRTGVFDDTLEATVKKWQASKGLVVDGIIGDKTWALMFPAQSCTPGNNPLSCDVLLKTTLPTLMPKDQIPRLGVVFEKYPLNTGLRLAHFLAQCGHESMGFTVFEENLNYSAEGLLTTFDNRVTKSQALKLAHNPQAIANFVYANRMGNGSPASGDGWKFRGRGPIQLTGKYEYEKLSDHTGINFIANPDLVATDYAFLSAGFFFEQNMIWKLCDGGRLIGDISKVTREINPDMLGLQDRAQRFNKLYPVVGRL